MSDNGLFGGTGGTQIQQSHGTVILKVSSRRATSACACVRAWGACICVCVVHI